MVKTPASEDAGIYSNVAISGLDVQQHCEALADALQHRHEGLPASFVGDARLSGPLANAVASRMQASQSTFFTPASYSASCVLQRTAAVLFPGSIGGLITPDSCMEIRPLTPEECRLCDDSLELLFSRTATSPQTVSQDFVARAAKSGDTWACFHKNRFVAMAWLRTTAAGGKNIVGAHTVPQSRKRGYATQLLRAVVQALLESRNFSYLSVVYERGTDAEGLCKRIGFGTKADESYVIERYETVKKSRFGMPELALGMGIAAVMGWWIRLT